MRRKIIPVIAALLALCMSGCGASAADKTAETEVTTTAVTTTAETTTTAKAAEAETETTTAASKKKSKKKKKSDDSGKADSSEKETKKEKETKAEPAAADGSSDKEIAQAYMDEFTAAFKGYSTPLTKTYSDAIESRDFDAALKALDEAEAGLDELLKVEAPDKYKDLQADVFKGLEAERQTIDYSRKFTELASKYYELECKESPTEEDMKEALKLADEMTEFKEMGNALSEESGFTGAFMTLIKTVKADINGTDAE